MLKRLAFVLGMTVVSGNVHAAMRCTYDGLHPLKHKACHNREMQKIWGRNVTHVLMCPAGQWLGHDPKHPKAPLVCCADLAGNVCDLMDWGSYHTRLQVCRGSGLNCQ